MKIKTLIVLFSVFFTFQAFSQAKKKLVPVGKALNTSAIRYKHIENFAQNNQRALFMFYYRNDCDQCINFNTAFLSMASIMKKNRTKLVILFERQPPKSMLDQYRDNEDILLYMDIFSHAKSMAGKRMSAHQNRIETQAIFNYVLFGMDGKLEKTLGPFNQPLFGKELREKVF
jgi:hypothetical protein